MVHEWGLKYDSFICNLSKIDLFNNNTIIIWNQKKGTLHELNMGYFIACEQAPSEGGKKTFGDRKRESASEASGTWGSL